MASTKHSLEQRTSPLPSGAKGGIPVASSTTDTTWHPVGADGKVLTADSSATNGISYQYIGALPSGLVTLKETVFAGLTPQSFSTGTTTTLDGSGYTCTLTGNGAADIVASGLRLRQGTTSGAGFQTMAIATGNTGPFVSYVGEGRWRRGSWAFWTRLASYDFTNTSAQVFGVIGELAHLTGLRWGISHRKNRNANGAPNTTVGGSCWDYFWNGIDISVNSYFGISSADVICTYVRCPDMVDIYIGTYSGGWPTMESMTLWATVRMQ